MTGRWSTEIEQRYSLQLPDDVRVWLDEQIWKDAGGAEFRRAQTPEQLMDPVPGSIWAGFMLPDTLPIIGNDYGDWLCLRIAADGSVSELVHWSHCGGDWIPYGQNLAEGLLYDAAVHVLFPQRASFAESGAGGSTRLSAWPSGPAGGWQTMAERCRVSGHTPMVRRPDANGAAILNELASAGIAEFAVRRDRILGHLDSPFKSHSRTALAQELGVPWEPEYVSWLFDTARIPAPARSASHTGWRSMRLIRLPRTGVRRKRKPSPCWSDARTWDGRSTSRAGRPNDVVTRSWLRIVTWRDCTRPGSPTTRCVFARIGLTKATASSRLHGWPC